MKEYILGSWNRQSLSKKQIARVLQSLVKCTSNYPLKEEEIMIIYFIKILKFDKV